MKKTLAAAVISGLGLFGCAATPPTIPPVAHVDLQRFMGDWYVIAHIPSRKERHAFDALETYRLSDDGRIRTTFTYRDSGFDGPQKKMEPVGRVVPGTGNAVWGMQFIWPIQAEYVIVDLAPDYSHVIIGRSKRDYVWLMARTPQMQKEALRAAIDRIGALGYDLNKLRMVPQSKRAP